MKLTHQVFDAEGFGNAFSVCFRQCMHLLQKLFNAAIKMYPNRLCQSQPHTEMMH